MIKSKAARTLVLNCEYQRQQIVSEESTTNWRHKNHAARLKIDYQCISFKLFGLAVTRASSSHLAASYTADGDFRIGLINVGFAASNTQVTDNDFDTVYGSTDPNGVDRMPTRGTNREANSKQQMKKHVRFSGEEF